MPIADGATSFLTFGASTSAPPAQCPPFVAFENDIWYLYIAPCTGTATFSLCNEASFDSVLAVYYGFDCTLPLNPLACSDDAPGCAQTSQAQLLVFQGLPYLVRVGGRTGGGIGVLTVSCQPLP